MSTPVKIHQMKQGRRPHFIPEWCEKFNLIQAELAEKLGADPGLVSRWFSGSTPSLDYQRKLAELFDCETDGIFRHPDEDWMARFLRGRPREEVDRIKNTLEAAFPRKVANDK